MPPLDDSVVTLVRELWPEATWTQAMRQEWRVRLAMFPVERVSQAIRDSYADNTGRHPRLDDVIVRVRASAMPRNEWKDRQPDVKDIVREYEAAKKMLSAAPPEKKQLLMTLYREKVGTELPDSMKEWKRNQVMIAAALFRTM